MKRQLFLTLVFVSALIENALAVTAPVTTDKFYQIYDIVVNDIVIGPPGMSIAVGGLAFAGVQFFKNAFIPAVGAAVGSIIVLTAPAIAEGLGAVIV
jgi:hypothetical protein